MAEEEIKILKTQKEYDELVKEQYKWHTDHDYGWLTEEVVDNYRAKYRAALQNGGNEVEERKKYCTELQELYGLTEMEATNILNGFHAQDYISKYSRIHKLIPVKRKEIKEDEF